MVNRSYIGDPIDATMQFIKERPNKGGETVAGSTEDDLGNEGTDALPSFVDEDNYSERELNIIRHKILFPNLSLREFCQKFDYGYQNTSTFLSTFRRHHRERLEDAGLFEALQPPQSRVNQKEVPPPDMDDLAAREAVREYWRANPEATVSDLREDIDVPELSDPTVSGLKAAVVANADEETTPGESPELEIEQAAAEFRKEVESLRSEIEQLKRQQETKSDDATVAELDSDTLFTIISGGELSEAERREVFKLVVNNE